MRDMRLAALVASCAALGISIVPISPDDQDSWPNRKDPDPRPETVGEWCNRLSNEARPRRDKPEIVFVDKPKSKGKRALRRAKGKGR